MKNTARALAFLLQFATLGLAIAFVITRLWPETAAQLRGAHAPATAPATAGGASTTAPASPSPLSSSGSGPVSYADAVARAAPAVVNIYANKIITLHTVARYLDPATQRLFGAVPGPTLRKREQSLGSGVIVSADGYVLTNYHVIAAAEDIQVLLYDGRVAQARVVGSDEETDLAVLKIDVTGLPTLALDATSLPGVGDVVLAIGNPFGIGKTVTMGIVSALGRQLGQWAYEDFIQTDAAINAGNSGGALISARGELVGINTANYREQSGAEGIGFAIPVKTAKGVLDQIIAHGLVVRGFIGAEFGPVQVAADSALPAAARGAMVLDVYPGNASQAGLQPGDVLLRIDDHDILDAGDLRSREAAMKPGTKVHLAGLRAGQPIGFDVELVQRPAPNRVRVPSG
jgi:serine protease DegS/serine protease DegQ